MTTIGSPFFLLIGARHCWWFRLRATLGLNNPLWSDVSMNCQDKLLLNLPFGMPSNSSSSYLTCQWQPSTAKNVNGNFFNMMLELFNIGFDGSCHIFLVHYDSQHIIACSLMIWKDRDHLRAELKLFCCWFCLVIFIKKILLFLILADIFLLFGRLDDFNNLTWINWVSFWWGDWNDWAALLRSKKLSEIHVVFGQNIFFIFIESRWNIFSQEHSLF